MKHTKERCIPEYMSGKIKTLQHHYARYVFALMYCRNKKVLDAACGSGFGTNMLYDIAERIMGVDISEKTIKYARGKYNGNFQEYDLEKEFPDGQFDIVVSFETIEHLNNPDVFLNNIEERRLPLLFSLPLNQPNEFHKQVFSMEEAVSFMSKFFNDIDWFYQSGLNIVKGLKNSKYLIGYAKNI